MPNVMHTLDDVSREQAAIAITNYLVSLSGSRFNRQPIDAAAAGRGKVLFHEVGCVACHSPRDDRGTETLPGESVALGNVSAKYSLVGLTDFLEDPHSVRPSGRMPNLNLTHWEATDLASYLLSIGDVTAGDLDVLPPNDDVVETGRRQFNQLGCANCHQTGDAESEAEVVTTQSLRLDQLAARVAAESTDGGCLSDSPGDAPRYQLDDDQRQHIREAIGQLEQTLTDTKQVELTLATLRCYSCHERDRLGGISDERDVFFHTTNENLGPQGRIPPSLTGVGGKLKSKWMRQVLVSGRVIRPYVKTRMPQFGTENVEHLVDLFAKVDPRPLAELPPYDGPGDDSKEAKKVGTELVGSSGLNCVACHTFQQKPAQTMPAVDLTEMAERLHEEWFVEYMRAPQLINPGTVMPSFWPGGKAIRKDIAEGDSDKQVRAIWEYLRDGRQARTPRGLRLKPMQLLASEGQAVMLRRSYRDIGKRGIGVGYPHEVNLAYDAEQMRWALLWKGPFADPGGVWRSQGHGTVRPLSPKPVKFQKGPDLDDADAPWQVDGGRPPNHQFTGYTLDDVGRPAFSYRFEEVEVEDYSVDIEPSPTPGTQANLAIIERTIRLSSKQPRNGLAFRVANGKAILSDDAKRFLVDDSLRIEIKSGQNAEVIDAAVVSGEETQQLIIPLDIPSGKTEIVIRYELK